MANITLYIENMVTRMTLKVMLEAEGHRMVDVDANLAITDDPEQGVALAQYRATLLLATAARIPECVRAMRAGVFGYIYVPLQPGEAPLMVRRALEWQEVSTGTVRDAEEEPQSLEEVEARHIRETLRRCKNNQARAARVLGIGRNTLWRKLKKYDRDSVPR